MYIDILEGLGYTGTMNLMMKLLIFILTAGILPVLSGLLPVSFLPQRKRRIPLIMMAGCLSSFAIFEIIGLPILLYTTDGDFALLCRCFTLADCIWIAAGAVRCVRTGGIRLPGNLETAVSRRSGRGTEKEKTPPGREALVYWGIFAVLLAYELYKAYTTASFDGDDAYYVAQSLQTWETETMYYYVPYTGYTTPLDGRHAMAMAPMWIAYIAKLSCTHPTIITHSLMPLVLIPAADICFYTAACQLTADVPAEKKEKLLPGMMILLAVLQIFGNVSIYTTQTFLLMRTWQGKTIFANLILPAAVALLAGKFRFEQRETFFWWEMLLILNVASGFCTSLAPALLTGFLMVAAGVAAILWKKWKLIPAMLAACIPNILYLLLLLRVSGIGFAVKWLPFLKGGRLP